MRLTRFILPNNNNSIFESRLASCDEAVKFLSSLLQIVHSKLRAQGPDEPPYTFTSAALAYYTECVDETVIEDKELDRVAIEKKTKNFLGSLAKAGFLIRRASQLAAGLEIQSDVVTASDVSQGFARQLIL